MKRIGILRGGTGNNFEASIFEGGNMIRHIGEYLGDKYKTVDILIDKQGSWHLNGLPTLPWDLIDKVDVIWDTLGSNDSTILKSIAIPTLGKSTSAFMFENNRELLKNTLRNIGVKMPRHIVLPAYQADFDGDKDKYILKKAGEIHAKFGAPWIVKSYNRNPAMGIHIAKTYPELINALEDAVAHGDSILIEELITGASVPAHSVSSFRNKDIYVFPLKAYSRQVSGGDSSELTGLVETLHKQLGVKHYMNAHFVINPRSGIYVTHLSFLPDLTSESHLHTACDSIGAKVHHVIESILDKAIK